MTKKLIALLLSTVMIFSFTACKDNTVKQAAAEDVAEAKKSTVEQALTLVEKGDIYGAYDLLYNIKNRTEEEQKLFEKFQFVKVSDVKKDIDGNVVYDEQCVYNDDGYLLTHNFVDNLDDETWTLSETNTYDENNRLLTYTNNDGDEVVHTYDENGNILSSQYSEDISEEFTYHSNGKIASYTFKNPLLHHYNFVPELYSTTYNENGSVLKINYTSLYSNYDKIFTYDENGNNTSIVHTELNVYNVFSDTFYDRISSYTYTYDEKGNLLTEDLSRNDGHWEKVVNTYDGNGNLLSKTENNLYDYTSGTYYDVTYTYDEKGNVLTENVSRHDGSWTKKVSTYDGNSNRLSYEYSDSDGSLEKETNTYDSNGNLLSCERSNSDGSWSKEINTYDSNGNILTWEHFDSKDDFESKTYTYNANGDILTYNYYHNDNEVHDIYTYDENGNVTISKENLESRKSETYTYDEQGRVLTYDSISNGYTDESISYTYDKQGNKTYTNHGYITTCDKYGNVIKDEWDSEASYDDSWGSIYYYEPSYYYGYYSYKLFYYPDGVPQRLLNNCFTGIPRVFDINNEEIKTNNPRTYNFYYSKSPNTL